MKTIPLSEALALLSDASSVVIDNVVTYPSLSDLTNEPDNEFMMLGWTDEEGYDFSVKFSEGANQTVRLGGSSLWMIDHEGEETQLTLLVPAKLEEEQTPTDGPVPEPSEAEKEQWPLEEWQIDAGTGDTKLGYNAWVAHRVESAKDEGAES